MPCNIGNLALFRLITTKKFSENFKNPFAILLTEFFKVFTDFFKNRNRGRLTYCKALYIKKIFFHQEMAPEHRSQENGKGLVLLCLTLNSLNDNGLP